MRLTGVWAVTAGMCMFGDNPRTTNQYDNALQFSVAYTGASPSGSLRVTFNGHRSIPFTADLTIVSAALIVQWQLPER